MLENNETSAAPSGAPPKKPVADIENPPRKPVVSYENLHGRMSGKGALAGAAVGFAYSIVRGKSKIFWTLVGSVIGSSIETVIVKMSK